MVRILIMAMLVAVISAQSSLGTGKRATVEGEVICLTCYLKDGETATGHGHTACAVACYSQGLPQAILEKGSGKLYLPLDTEHSRRGTAEERFVCSLVEHVPARERLRDFLGETITVVGTVFPGNGVTLLALDRVVESQ